MSLNQEDYSMEDIQEYIASVVREILDEKRDNENWNVNKEFHDQVFIREG